jgi:hypothetical protein
VGVAVYAPTSLTISTQLLFSVKAFIDCIDLIIHTLNSLSTINSRTFNDVETLHATSLQIPLSYSNKYQPSINEQILQKILNL